MRLSNTLAISLRNILKNKTRSLLTALGIIIGVGSVIVMVGIGTGSRVRIENQIASMGTNLIMVQAGGQRSGGGISQGAGTGVRLTLSDVERLRKDATLVQALSPNVPTQAQVIAGAQNWRTQVYGVSASYPEIRNYTIAAGAFFTETDVKTSASVAVLGPTVAGQLFPDADPVGQRLRINQVPFTVIGVCDSKGQGGFGDQDDYVLVPYTTAMNKLTGTTYLRSIFVSAVSADNITQAQEQITTLLREQHKIRAGMADDFRIGSQKELLDTATQVSDTFTALLAAVAAVSLLVGGIGIMNIMLVSVTERTREIGIRKAVGARSRDILFQFLVESVVLSGIGGLMGVGAGVGGSRIVAAVGQWETAVASSSIALAFGVAMAIGVFFGLYPAHKASRLDPIEALRHE